jgi:hypothetical protein
LNPYVAASAFTCAAVDTCAGPFGSVTVLSLLGTAVVVDIVAATRFE